MACNFCNHQGFIDSQVFRDAGSKGIVKQCPHCRDTRAYSQEILRRIGHVMPKDGQDSGPRPMAQVIPFPVKK